MIASKLDILFDLYATVPETAGRIRQRLDAIFDDAVVRDHAYANPAAMIRRKLFEVGRRKKVEHFRPLPYSVGAETAKTDRPAAQGARVYDDTANDSLMRGAGMGATQFDPSFSVPPLALPGGVK